MLLFYFQRSIRIMITSSRNCPVCGKSFHGRIDKKFCTSHCRNAYHNRLNSDSNNYMRTIDHCLKRNRRILQLLLHARSFTKASMTQLQGKGFAFGYHTHTHVNRQGHVYRYCYEYGYLLMEDGQVGIRRGNVEYRTRNVEL